MAKDKEILFPKLDSNLNLIKFSNIAKLFLKEKGYSVFECKSEDEARNSMNMVENGSWPCYFFKSDTTGEKDFEEFFTTDEKLDLNRFNSIGVIENNIYEYDKKLSEFKRDIEDIYSSNHWSKKDLIEIFNNLLKNFNHLDRGKYLDDKM